jgi:biopolymer transport protein ExbD
MARNFRRHDRMSAISGIEISPLMDLAFSMLIIFMISTPLVEQSIQIDLPVESAKTQKPPEEKTEVIGIGADRVIYWGDRAVNKDELAELLGAAAARPEQPIITLRADKALDYQSVIEVIDLIEQAGLVKLNIDTQAGAPAKGRKK